MKKKYLFAIVFILGLAIQAWAIPPLPSSPTASASVSGLVTIDGTGANSVMGSTTSGGVDTPRNAVALPSGSRMTWTPITSDPAPAVQGTNYIADTSSALFTITLPASPSNGGSISILDGQGTFGTNALTIAGNGNTIMGSSSYVLSSNNANLTLVYYTAGGWRIQGMQSASLGLVFSYGEVR